VARQCNYGYWLWIDQICIAQSNIAERNGQVALMATIYTHASMGLVWLGKHPSDGPGLVYDYLERCKSTPVDKLNSWKQLTDEEQADAGLLKRFNDAREAFCSNPYWTRVWIIQELKLLRYYEFWWDVYVLPHRGFSNLWHKMWFWDRPRYHPNKERITWLLGETSHPEANATGSPTLSTSYPRYIFSGRHRRQAEYKLRDVVKQICEADCADPRDKIFGVQSILCAESQQVVDYNQAPCEILHEAWKVLLAEWRGRNSGGPNLQQVLSLCHRLTVSVTPDVNALSVLEESLCAQLLQEGFEALLNAGPRATNIIWFDPEAEDVLETVTLSSRGKKECDSTIYDNLTNSEKAMLCTKIVLEEIVEHKYVRMEVSQALQKLDRRNAQHAAETNSERWNSKEFLPYNSA
jgi:hypothetical protein